MVCSGTHPGRGLTGRRGQGGCVTECTVFDGSTAVPWEVVFRWNRVPRAVFHYQTGMLPMRSLCLNQGP